MQTVVDLQFALPASGPSLKAIDALAYRLGRTLEEFVAFSLTLVTRQIEEEAGREDLAFPAEQALFAHLAPLLEKPAEVEEQALRLDVELPGDAPQLEDADHIAGQLGLSRKHYLSACLLANYELQTWLLENREADGFVAASDKAIARLPNGYSEKIVNGEGDIVQSHELAERRSGNLLEEDSSLSSPQG